VVSCKLKKIINESKSKKSYKIQNFVRSYHRIRIPHINNRLGIMFHYYYNYNNINLIES